jgi:hypothetical protein
MVFDEREDEFDLEELMTAEAEHRRHVHSWMVGEDGDGQVPWREAEDLALLSEPCGAQMMAWQRRTDIEHPCLAVPMTFERALEDLFGKYATLVCRRHGLELQPESRLRLLAHIADVVDLGAARLTRRAAGDYGPDENMARFPTFVEATKVTVAVLFERWQVTNKDRIEASTIRRYTPSLNSLAKFLGEKDVRRVTQADIFDWAEHRRDKEGIAASTVNRNDLVAASAIFAFASGSDPRKKLRNDNPVKDVKLIVPKKDRLRLPFFNPSEVGARRQAPPRLSKGKRIASLGPLDLRLQWRARAGAALAREEERMSRRGDRDLGHGFSKDQERKPPDCAATRRFDRGRFSRVRRGGTRWAAFRRG